MFPFSIVSAFADDIRSEADGRVTVVGIMPDNLKVTAVPGMIPKIAIYTRLHVPTEQDISPIQLSLQSMDGSVMELAAFDSETIKSARELSLAQGTPYFGLVAQAIASPLAIPSVGSFRVIATMNDHDEICGVLNVIVAN